MPGAPGRSGGPRPNSGRKKGSGPKYSKELADKLNAEGALTPLDLFTCVVNDTKMSIEARLLAARGAAPYVHKRKPQALEIGGKFEFLSPEERELRRQLLLEEIRLDIARRSALSEN